MTIPPVYSALKPTILNAVRIIATLLGQFVHSSPILFCIFGMCLGHFSIWTLLLIPIAFFSNVLMVGIADIWRGIVSGVRIYYDFCLRFAGCPLVKYEVNEYLSQEAWDNARRLVLMRAGVRNPERIDKRNDTKIFVVKRNIKNGETPKNLAAYMGSGRPQSSYIFTRDTAEQSQRSVWGKFKVLHEVGHTSRDAQFLSTPLYMGWIGFVGVVSWILVSPTSGNLSFYFSAIASMLLILTLGRILESSLLHERWFLDEAGADHYALRNLRIEERQQIVDDISKGFLSEPGRSDDENRRRLEIFVWNSKTMDEGESPNIHLPSAQVNHAWAGFSIIGIALIHMGASTRPIEFVNLVIYIGVLVGFPLIVVIGLVTLGIRINVVVAESVHKMTIDGEPKPIALLNKYERFIKPFVLRKTR